MKTSERVAFEEYCRRVDEEMALARVERETEERMEHLRAFQFGRTKGRFEANSGRTMGLSFAGLAGFMVALILAAALARPIGVAVVAACSFMLGMLAAWRLHDSGCKIPNSEEGQK